jgi:hypothetical protein
LFAVAVIINHWSTVIGQQSLVTELD